MTGLISQEGDLFKVRSGQGGRAHPTVANDRPGTAALSGALPDASLSLQALQVSFPFSGEQHEVHSLRSLADAGLVGMALAGKCGQRGPSLLPRQNSVAHVAWSEKPVALSTLKNLGCAPLLRSAGG